MRHRFQVRMALVLGLLFSCAAGASFSGSFRSSTDYYPEHLGEQTDDLVPYLVLDLNGKHRLRKNLRFQWRLYGLANLESESEPEQYYGDISEGFLEWKLSDLRWRLGVNTLNWGIVDVSSPMDVVNTPAFFHPTRIHKQGAPMVELDWKPERLGVHGIYIPKQRRAELPSTDSRWLPRSFLTNPGNAEGTVVLPDFIEYRFGEPETLSKALDNNWGIRLTSNLGSFDFALMHFEGAAPSPKVRPTIVADAGSTPTEVVARSSIDLQVVSYRVRTSGFGFAWAGDNLIVRVESAYQHTISEDPLLQPWSWGNVLALETNVAFGEHTATVLAQYYYTENPQAPDNQISSSYRLFDRTGLIGARVPWSEELLITGSVLYESRTQGVFWMLGFENKLSDVLRWGIAYRDLSASRDGLLKTYDKNDHAVLDLTYFF